MKALRTVLSALLIILFISACEQAPNEPAIDAPSMQLGPLFGSLVTMVDGQEVEIGQVMVSAEYIDEPNINVEYFLSEEYYAAGWYLSEVRFWGEENRSLFDPTVEEQDYPHVEVVPLTEEGFAYIQTISLDALSLLCGDEIDMMINAKICRDIPPTSGLTFENGTHLDVVLLAGQHIECGRVTATVNDDHLTVEYTTTDGWGMDEVHLAVANSLEGIPTNKRDLPKIGQFEFKLENMGGATVHRFTMPMSDLFIDCGGTVYLAAHAVVEKTHEDGSVQNETAWGDGIRFDEESTWSTYNTFVVPCYTAVGSTECMSAWGKSTNGESREEVFGIDNYLYWGYFMERWYISCY